MKKIVLLDNGHGKETPGKRSPDGTLLEYNYTREITKRIKQQLDEINDIKCIRIVEEDDDIGLSARARRVNKICDEYGTNNVILISVHLNAAGNGSSWLLGRGWEAWTSRGKTESDKLAKCISDAVNEVLIPKGFINRGLKESGFTILTKTKCAAVLTENLFQDNKTEVDYLKSEEGIESIVELHIKGIKKYLEL